MANTGSTETRCWRLRAGAATLADDGRGALQVVRLGAQARLQTPPGWTSVWLPIAEQLRVHAGAEAWSVPRSEVLVWRDGALCGSTGRAGLVVAAPDAGWRARLGASGTDAGPAVLLPDEAPASPAVRRAAATLVRSAAHSAAIDAARAADAYVAAVLEQQRDLLARLPRCTGRTAERREHTMLRLLRVRHLVRRHVDGRLDVARMARSASYSPCHLIRIFRDVFDETPTEYAARLRDQHAWRLVRDTALPVAAITDVLGFESASAFCRAFKATFGITATQARRSVDARSAQAA